MPKIRPYNEALRREQEIKDQRSRVIRIICAATEANDYDRAELCEHAHIDYQTFNRRMRGESDFRLAELCGIANALKMDTMTRAALCGAKEKCRYETGYRI